VIDVEGKALDVLRFCVCEVDVTEAASFDDILETTAKALRRLLEDDDSEDRTFAVRLVLDGSPGVGVLLMHAQSRCLDRIRRLASSVGQGRIWIEQVRARGGAPLFSEWAVGTQNASTDFVGGGLW